MSDKKFVVVERPSDEELEDLIKCKCPRCRGHSLSFKILPEGNVPECYERWTFSSPIVSQGLMNESTWFIDGSIYRTVPASTDNKKNTSWISPMQPYTARVVYDMSTGISTATITSE